MAFTGQQILDRARDKANDVTPTHWLDTEALRWLNDSMRAIVNRLWKAGATSAQPTTVAGSRQTLTGLGLTSGIGIIDVVCNVTGTGARSTPIRKTSRSWLNDNLPAWHTDTSGPPEYWVFDEQDPLAFYLWPSPVGKIELIYANVPADLTNLSQSYGLADIYADAAALWVLYSFFSKDITKLKSAAYMQTYYQLFLNSLGIRDESIKTAWANVQAKEQGQ